MQAARNKYLGFIHFLVLVFLKWAVVEMTVFCDGDRCYSDLVFWNGSTNILQLRITGGESHQLPFLYILLDSLIKYLS